MRDREREMQGTVGGGEDTGERGGKKRREMFSIAFHSRVHGGREGWGCSTGQRCILAKKVY